MYFAEFTDRGRENTEYKGKKEVHPPSPSSPVCTHIHMHGNSPWLPFFKAVAASDTQTPAREVNGMKIAVSRQDYIFSFPAIVCSSRREHRRPPRAAAAPRTPAGDAGTLPGPGEGPQPSAALSPPGPARPGWLQRAPKLREAISPQPRQTACFAEGGGAREIARGAEDKAQPLLRFPVVSVRRYRDTRNPVTKLCLCPRTIWHRCYRAGEPVVPERDHATVPGRKEGDLQP